MKLVTHKLLPTKVPRSFFKITVFAVVFGIIYLQDPLYEGNQNTKFLHGLAKAGLGYLDRDWLANTLDPLPAFSKLVEFSYLHFGEVSFYIYQILCLGVYLYSLLGITSQLFGFNNKPAAYLLNATLLIYSHVIAIGIGGENDIQEYLYQGFAEQFIISHQFQPSTLGVFLLLSIYLFLNNYAYSAVALLALACIFHPVYLPGAAFLTLTYMVITVYRERNIRKAFLMGCLCLLLVLPVVIYTLVFFEPTSLAIWQRAQEIIINYRIPHHSHPEIWLKYPATILQISAMILGLLVARNTRIFPILAFPLLLATLMTVYKMLGNSGTLAFTTPWRISVVLVPLSTALIIAWLVRFIFAKFTILSRYRRLAIAFSLTALTVLFVSRAALQVEELELNDETIPLMNYVKTHKQADDVYLMPIQSESMLGLPKLQKFRLYTGAPIFINFKSHPYKDVEVLEWYERVNLALKFYEAPSRERACQILDYLQAEYQVTHVVLNENNFNIQCPDFNKLFQDDSYALYAVK
ncbi:DUF6798 domain-containing protein [Myxosarcina sp. GI1]|uniref:DUF6798 domain-containing protein n=1 Tax=Myxosarcina sp. GI1 TaxID=1541065 RepID=UPI00056A7981|nr:DUF6798 domain-containing protein [Myxosarcina sp. GI1]